MVEQEKPQDWLRTVLLVDEPGISKHKISDKGIGILQPMPFWPPLGLSK